MSSSLALIDRQQCLRKGTDSSLVKHLCVVDISSKIGRYNHCRCFKAPLSHYLVNGGSSSDLVASIEERLNYYTDATKKTVVFDKYQSLFSLGLRLIKTLFSSGL